MKIFSEDLVARAAQELHIANLSTATIGEVLLMAQYLERETGIPFIRMDQGSPGLPVNRYGVEAEKAALDRGVGSQYPAAAGVPELKEAASQFVKAFLDVDITPRSCVPTTGSVAGSYGSFIACTPRAPGKNKVNVPGRPTSQSRRPSRAVPMGSSCNPQRAVPLPVCTQGGLTGGLAMPPVGSTCRVALLI